MKGWVYVISNPSLPGLVKIGYSMKDPHLRAGNDFDPAGLPDDFVVEYHALVENPREVEQLAHAKLRDHRYKKEWFRIGAAEAIAAIRHTVSINGAIYFEDSKQVSRSSPPPRTEAVAPQNGDLSGWTVIKRKRLLDKDWTTELVPLPGTAAKLAHQAALKTERQQILLQNPFYFCPVCRKKNMVKPGWASHNCTNCGSQTTPQQLKP